MFFFIESFHFLTKASRPIVEENCSPVEDRIPFFHTNYDVPKTYDIYLDGDIYLSDLDFSENITMIGGGFLGTDSKICPNWAVRAGLSMLSCS